MFKFRPFYYEQDETGGANPPATPPPTAPVTTAPVATAPATTPPTPDKAFTQADVDRIIGERLARQRATLETEMLTTLGVGTLDAAKQLISAANEAERAKLTEIERLQADITAMKASLAETTAKAATAEKTLLMERRNGKLTSVLQAAGAVDVPMALIALTGGDESKFMTENGVDEAAVTAALETLKKEKAYMFGANNPTGYRGIQSVRKGVAPSTSDNQGDAAYNALRRKVFGN